MSRDPNAPLVPFGALRAMTCPRCTAALDSHQTLEAGVKPAAGDVTVCWRCEGLAVFALTEAAGWHLRAPAGDELRELERSADVRAARSALSGARYARRGPDSIGTPVDAWWLREGHS